MKRAAAIDLLTAHAVALAADRPVCVGIDGRSAAGKSTLAEELCDAVRARGRPVVHASMDSFHPKGYKDRRDWTFESYYREGYDFDSFRRLLLEPATSGGSRRCRTGIVRSVDDSWLPEEWVQIEEHAVVVVDGFFLLRSDLVDYFDFTVWVEVDWETMLARACKRDVAWVGSVERVTRLYRGFWIPMHQYYEERDQPQQRASALLTNEPIESPRLTFR